VDSEALHALSLAVSEEHSVDKVLRAIVEGLARQEGVALARVWLVAPGDICATCPMAGECPERSRCLHLVASAGRSRSGRESWDRLDGEFRRFPLNVRKIGRVGGTGEAILLKDLNRQTDWIRHAGWVKREQLESFAAQPLLFRGEVLGVLAIFSRQPIGKAVFSWLRSFADQAGVAIANSRAFSEIERLRKNLELENDYLREEVRTAVAPGGIVGSSPGLRRTLEQLALVAPTETTVLVLGESGTGKELVARAIHYRSARRDRPLIKVNCGSIPRELFESEFFGHVKGSFTGALRDRLGRFQLADGGTLFLDEVGEIPLELQPKLLRVLQEGELERVGDEKTTSVNVRVIAATNRDLPAEIEAGRFRQDLYYRLSVFPIEIPPLRERADDVPALARHFVELARARVGSPDFELAARELEALASYSWPGNVRELQNVIERAVILSTSGKRFDIAGVLPAVHAARVARRAARRAEPALEDFVTEKEWREREKANLVAALRRARWKVYGVRGAAALLGIKPTTLVSRMKALGIARPD
jgi:transcriptional regulator with GAF, ATPase, and Fis domain